MKSTVHILESLVVEHEKLLVEIQDSDFSAKPNPAKWSKKEILGHLVDSAHNNLRRFIVAQYEDNPTIVYKQEFWVSASAYQQYNKDELITLWVAINTQICRVLIHLPPGAEKKECMSEASHAIEWLAQDYIKHLKHHMHVILNREPVAYP